MCILQYKICVKSLRCFRLNQRQRKKMKEGNNCIECVLVLNIFHIFYIYNSHFSIVMLAHGIMFFFFLYFYFSPHLNILQTNKQQVHIHHLLWGQKYIAEQVLSQCDPKNVPTNDT